MIDLTRIIQVQSVYTAIEPIWGENFRYKRDRHNFWELVYVVEGCAGILKDDKIYELSPGEMIFHMPMEFHSIWAKNSQKLHLVVINFSLTGTAATPLNNGIFRPDESAVSLIYQTLDYVCHCSEFDDGLKNQMISNNLERLLLTLLAEQSEFNTQKRRIGNRNYETIIKAMNDNLDKRLSIDELAEICKLSSSNLKKTFRKFSGMGVIEYFNQLKTTEAIRLLNEDIPIARISEQLGYSSPGYFCDSFKHHCGVTPSEYKRKFKSTATYKK